MRSTPLSQAIQIWTGDPKAAPLLVNAYFLRASAHLAVGRQGRRGGRSHPGPSNPAVPRTAPAAHGLLDALAASYAEAAQFADAARWEQKAVENAPDDATRKVYQGRLEKYQAARP